MGRNRTLVLAAALDMGIDVPLKTSLGARGKPCKDADLVLMSEAPPPS